MGCTKSKLDEKVCLKDETTSMHIAYINKHGLQKYYEIMGISLRHSWDFDTQCENNSDFFYVCQSVSWLLPY